MISAGPTGIVFFDVDGTLVPATSSSAFLAGFLGHRDVLVEAEAAYASGDMSNQQVSAIDAAGWAGRSPQEIEAWLDDLPLIDGISETLAWCQANQLAPVLATLAWSPVGHYLTRRSGFLSYSGPELEVLDGKFTGYVARDFDEFDKRDTALAQARRAADTVACVRRAWRPRAGPSRGRAARPASRAGLPGARRHRRSRSPAAAARRCSC